MATAKFRYIVFQIMNATKRPIQMSTDSFLNILKDRLYREYGLIGLSRFEDVYITLFLAHKQIVVFKVPRITKDQVINSMKTFEMIHGHKIRFQSIITVSSIKRLRKYFKKEYSEKKDIQTV